MPRNSVPIYSAPRTTMLPSVTVRFVGKSNRQRPGVGGVTPMKKLLIMSGTPSSRLSSRSHA